MGVATATGARCGRHALVKGPSALVADHRMRRQDELNEEANHDDPTLTVLANVRNVLHSVTNDAIVPIPE